VTPKPPTSGTVDATSGRHSEEIMTTRISTGSPVVVGIDGSDLSTVALAWGVDDARRRSRPLRLVHTTDKTGRAAGEELLNAASMRARRAVPDLDVSTVLADGHAADALLKQAAEADVIVLGSRGRSGFSRLLGSTSLQVAMHASCAVVVIRLAGEDAPPGPSSGRVVVGIDDSSRSERATDFAFRQADSRGIGVTAVLSWIGPDIDSTASPAHEWEQAAQDEQALLSERLAGRREEYPDVDIVEKTVRGDFTEALVHESPGAELLVVGSHGRGTVGGIVLGSVSQALLHRAHCPVAVVRNQ
jgi:nucleotide-binding universal stress UspA family protein